MDLFPSCKIVFFFYISLPGAHTKIGPPLERGPCKGPLYKAMLVNPSYTPPGKNLDIYNSLPRALLGTRIGGNGSYQPPGAP